MNNFTSSPNSRHEYTSQLSPLHMAISNFPPASTKSQCDYDLLKAKVTHLENERVNLSIQIQKQFENDRSTKMQIQALDSELKNRDNSVKNLARSLEELQDASKNLKEGKEEQFATILSLNGRIDLQTKAAIETDNLWSKITNAKREIKRLEEENVNMKTEKNDMETKDREKDRDLVTLHEVIQTKQKEMTILRLDFEVNCLAFKDKELLLKNINTDISSTLASLISVNEELSANLARDKESFLTQQFMFLEEIKDLKKQQNSHNLTSYHVEAEEKTDCIDTAKYDILINDLKHKLLQSEVKRKQLHNNLQELRGNM